MSKIIELSEDQQMIRDQVATFAKKEIAPRAEAIDREAKFPTELIQQLGEMGLMGITADPDFGGSGLDYLTYAIAGEEINAACASTGVIFSAHNSLAVGPINKFGNKEQKQKYLPDMCSGKRLGAFALSEPVSGSDAGALICKYTDGGDHFLVNGTKNWITNGPECDVIVLLATMDTDKKHKGISAFIVDKKTEGLSVGKVEEKLGIKGSGTSQLIFENVKVPKENILGNEGDGFKIAMATLDSGRIGIASQAVGIARGALEAALQFSSDRETFGKPVNRHQGPQFMIADMATKLEAARLLTWQAAVLQDRGEPFTKEAAMAKLFASEAANFITDKGLQLHGGYGFCKEYPAERFYRDQRITEIYEGTSEVQRIVIGSTVVKEFQG